MRADKSPLNGARYTMNRGFVRKVDDDEPTVVATGLFAAPLSLYLTQSGYTMLAEEMKMLVTRERPKVVEVVSWAAGNGDRSENGDYIYGKKRLREIDRRIGYLTKLLQNAKVVDPSTQTQKDKVFFGATVTYENEVGKRITVQIVGKDEANPSAGKINVASPLAMALLKKSKGESTLLKTPAGEEELEIVDIVYRVE